MRLEDQYFHWITNRALRALINDGELLVEQRVVTTGDLHIVRHPRCRYHARATTALVELVKSYSDPLVTRAVGDQGEMLVLEGFARRGFTMRGREMREYQGREWTETGHDLDFIFERAGKAYGVEVKNTLPYMPYQEFRTKIRMCGHLGLTPVFMCRFLPKTWIWEARRAGGAAIILKYQLYPIALSPLAERLRDGLGLPIGTPRRLEEGTMERVERALRVNEG